ncbi:hypothetical protein COCSADRAFT_34663, partial [Bipolaris sorokiniana ND90Pr]
TAGGLWTSTSEGNDHRGAWSHVMCHPAKAGQDIPPRWDGWDGKTGSNEDI